MAAYWLGRPNMPWVVSVPFVSATTRRSNAAGSHDSDRSSLTAGQATCVAPPGSGARAMWSGDAARQPSPPSRSAAA